MIEEREQLRTALSVKQRVREGGALSKHFDMSIVILLTRHCHITLA
jgi:hypothetical protein